MNRFELWDKVARCRLQQHFRLLVALWSKPVQSTMSSVHLLLCLPLDLLPLTHLQTARLPRDMSIVSDFPCLYTVQ